MVPAGAFFLTHGPCFKPYKSQKNDGLDLRLLELLQTFELIQDLGYAQNLLGTSQKEQSSFFLVFWTHKKEEDGRDLPA